MKPPGNLPGQLTSFVGREATIAMVGRRLQADRLVTLVGPGGCGKTRLALEAGRIVADLRPDGVFFVNLSGLSDPGLVPSAVLGALGRRAGPGRDPVGVLVTELAERDLILLLDNCEHLVEACASVVNAVMRGCPGVWALVTSRERLGVTGEVLVPVEGLELPDRARRDREDWIESSEAGRLFMDRAMRARPDFSIDDADAVVVAQICERLDGIPLAMELAAARATLMSVHAIAEGLSDRFRLLVGRGRAGPPRHKTLLASIEWSCGLLGEDEHALLRRLSVFASGFTLAAAEAVCSQGETGRDHVLGLLTSLVDKSLVQADARADRFRLHETMRAYASAALESEGATAAVRDHHLDYFTDLAKALGPKSSAGELGAALAALVADLDNMRAAFDWSVESRQFDAGADILVKLGRFFFVLGLNSEVLARCGRLLAAELGTLRRADLLYLASFCARNSDPSASLRLASELTALGRSLGDDRAVARGLRLVANVQAWAQPDEAVGTADEAMHLARKTGQHYQFALGLCDKAWAYYWLGRSEEAFSLAEEALGAAHDADLLWAAVNARTVTSIAATHSGRLARGLEEAEILLQLSTELSSPTFICWAERHRGEACMYLGEAGAARAFTRARALAESSDDTFLLACCQTDQGHLQVALGQQDDGYEILEAGNSKLETLGFARMCVNNRAVLAEVALRRGDLQAARRHLEASTWRLPRRPDPEGAPTLRAEARRARAEGCWQRSHALACDGLDAAASAGHLVWAVDLLELVAITSADLGRHADAARLVGAAELQREITGYVRWAPAREELAPVLVAVQAALRTEPFEQATSEGRSLTLEEAVAYARRGRGSHRRAVSGLDSLTPTERRVVSLVAKHLTNAEIADQLFVSTFTVKSHLTRVFAKLGVTDRRRLAEVAKYL